ncbi:unnamed protein product [Ixodes hexagonus]
METVLQHADTLKEGLQNCEVLQLVQSLNADRVRRFVEHQDQLDKYLEGKLGPKTPTKEGTVKKTAQVSTLKDANAQTPPVETHCAATEEGGKWTTDPSAAHQIASNAKETPATAAALQRHRQGSSAPTKAIVLRPTCKRNVNSFLPRVIGAAVKDGGDHTLNEVAIKVSDRSNTIALITKNAYVADKLLSIQGIPTTEGNMQVHPYTWPRAPTSARVWCTSRTERTKPTPRS